MTKHLLLNAIALAVLMHETRTSALDSTPLDVRKRGSKVSGINERKTRLLDVKEDGIIVSPIKDKKEDQVIISPKLKSEDGMILSSIEEKKEEHVSISTMSNSRPISLLGLKEDGMMLSSTEDTKEEQVIISPTSKPKLMPMLGLKEDGIMLSSTEDKKDEDVIISPTSKPRSMSMLGLKEDGMMLSSTEDKKEEEVIKSPTSKTRSMSMSGLKEDGIILSMIKEKKGAQQTTTPTSKSKSKSKSGAKSKSSSAKKSSKKSKSKSKPKSKSKSKSKSYSSDEISIFNLDTYEISCVKNNTAQSTNFTETQVATVNYEYKLETTVNSSYAPALLKDEIFAYLVNSICRDDRRLFERTAIEVHRRLEIQWLNSTFEDTQTTLCLPEKDVNNTCSIYEGTIVADISPYGLIDTTTMAESEIVDRLESYVEEEQYLKVEGVVAMTMLSMSNAYNPIVSSPSSGSYHNLALGMAMGIIYLLSV